MKKIFFVLPMVLVTLASCHMRGEQIPVKQAIKELGTCEVDVNKYDGVKASFTVSKVEFESTATMGKETQGQKITVEDIKLESSIGNVVSAKSGNELKEATTFSIKSISMDANGSNVMSLNNLYFGTFLDDGKMYVDLSNEGMYMLLCSSNSELENLPSRKFYQPVDFSGVTFPLVSSEALTAQSKEASEQLVQMLESEEFAAISKILEDYSKIYISKDHNDFDIYFDYKGNSLIPTDESSENAFNLSQNLYVHVYIEDGLVRKGDLSVDFAGESEVQGYTVKNKIALKANFNIDYGAKVDAFTHADEYTLLEDDIPSEM